MKRVLVILSIGLFACGQKTQETATTTNMQETVETVKSNERSIGPIIEGDFNGNGQKDFASVTKIQTDQTGADGTPGNYEIHFSRDILPTISAGCCMVILINEGDLNNDGAEDISLFQKPLSGCDYSMSTYSFKEGSWKQIVETFTIPNGCDLTMDDLPRRVFKENGAIYYYDIDHHDANGKLVKKMAKMLGDSQE